MFWSPFVPLPLLLFRHLLTTLIVHGINGNASFEIAVGMTLFTLLLVFVVAIANGIGTASVYRSLADYYPENMGSVGGLVGVIGGLGGFSLPIVFGIAADVTNVRSSAFMVMYAVLAGVMVWTCLGAQRAPGHPGQGAKAPRPDGRRAPARRASVRRPLADQLAAGRRGLLA